MIRVETGNRRTAFEAGLNAYGPHTPYISPMWSDIDRLLDPARNPLCRDGAGALEVFTAVRDGLPVGRIVASVHLASNRRHGTSNGQFGFFDCIDDTAVADALLAAAETWVAQRGADQIAGNFNLTAMQMVGVVTEGFEHPPYTDMMWTAPHISTHLERRGYAPVFPMSTFETEVAAADADALIGPKQRAVLEDPRYTWHPITWRTFKTRLEDARVILNAGFDKNPMFVPVSPDEYAFQAGEMMWIMDPRLSILVHYDGKPAGVVVCIPDLNPFVRATGSRISLTTPWHFLKHRMNRDRAVIVYYSVATALHGRGLNGAMLSRLIGQARAAGYKRLGTTWISDGNVASLRQMEHIGARRLHRLHLFSKPLDKTS